jgi:hypothetical protein
MPSFKKAHFQDIPHAPLQPRLRWQNPGLRKISINSSPQFLLIFYEFFSLMVPIFDDLQ